MITINEDLKNIIKNSDFCYDYIASSYSSHSLNLKKEGDKLVLFNKVNFSPYFAANIIIASGILFLYVKTDNILFIYALLFLFCFTTLLFIPSLKDSKNIFTYCAENSSLKIYNIFYDCEMIKCFVLVIDDNQARAEFCNNIEYLPSGFKMGSPYVGEDFILVGEAYIYCLINEGGKFKSIRLLRVYSLTDTKYLIKLLQDIKNNTGIDYCWLRNVG